MADDYTDEQTGLVDRIKESPRTVSALIIILIVAAAIYAFSGDQNQATNLGGGIETPSPTPEVTPAPDASPTATTTGDQTVTTSPAPTPVTVTQDELKAETPSLPQVKVTDTGYEESATAGDGITHLARRATTRWLSENQPGYTLTNEHRIYIEDYIKDQVGSEGLSLGETRTISFDLIKEAVAAAGELNAGQLQNLSHYTTAL